MMSNYLEIHNLPNKLKEGYKSINIFTAILKKLKFLIGCRNDR
jgi:hypothetical protein